MKKILISLLIASKAYADDNYIISQAGGYVGLLSAGVGTTLNCYDTSVVVGHVPPFIGGEELWQLTWKNSLKYSIELNGIRYTPIYGGANLLLSFDKDTFWLLPKHYPKGYYPPTGIHLAPSIGTEIKSNKHSLFIELTTLDFYAEAYVRNPTYLSLQDIITYGIGYKYILE